MRVLFRAFLVVLRFDEVTFELVRVEMLVGGFVFNTFDLDCGQQVAEPGS